MHDNYNDRVPTIFCEPDKLEPIGITASDLTPSKTMLKAVLARLKKAKSLWCELPFMQATDDEKNQHECVDRLVAIIAFNLICKELRKLLIREKEKAIDHAKKTKDRWEDRELTGPKRANKLKKFMQIALREMIAKEATGKSSAKLYKHIDSYYKSLEKELYNFFAIQTPHPNKFVTAIIGLFNLHPKSFCAGCIYFPQQRKPRHQHKNQSLTEMVRRGIGMCKIDNIFECPKRYQKL